MSDEEDSMSEGFSASEDEWKPSKNIKGGESSDDDDSDFEESPLTGVASAGSGASAGRKRGEPKARSAAKQTSSKKRTGLSLRAKLYNKYRPPPKTLSPPGSLSKNFPTASTSKSKNAAAPNESKSTKSKTNDGEDSGSSSDSSIDNYLVNPEDLDIQSSFFNVEDKALKRSLGSPAPVFDCNAGMENLSDSASDEEQGDAKNTFDFNNLLEYAKNIERVKESVAKHNAEEPNKKSVGEANIDTLDVYSVLALGEKQHNRSHNDGEDEDDEDDEGLGDDQRCSKNQLSKLSKTKSTRIKRHTKTRPTSTVAANDTDDSDWEEVADSRKCIDSAENERENSKILEIHVELPSRNREKRIKTQEEIENAFKRKLNRDVKERQVLLHKASLLCRFARIFTYNRLLNNSDLMQSALQLLPSKSAYPPQRGTEIKYFQSMVTWFKTAVILKTQNLYPEKSAGKTKSRAQDELLKQVKQKEARCKQDMVFIFTALLRGMGLHCRLIANMQPLSLKPSQTDLLTIKIKKDDKSEDKDIKSNESVSENLKASTWKVKEPQKETTKRSNEKSKTDRNSSDTSDTKTQHFEITNENKQKNMERQEIRDKKNKNEASIKDLKQTRSTTKKSNAQNVKDFSTLKEENNKCEENCKSSAKQASKIVVKEPKIPKTNTISVIKNLKSPQAQNVHVDENNIPEELDNSQKENETKPRKPTLARLKRTKPKGIQEGLDCSKKPKIESGSVVVPKIIVNAGKDQLTTEQASCSRPRRNARSRSKSPQVHISPTFLLQSNHYKDKFPGIIQQKRNIKNKIVREKSPVNKAKISTDFLKSTQSANDKKRVLRSRQKANDVEGDSSQAGNVQIPQLDGANDAVEGAASVRKRLNLKKLKGQQSQEAHSDDDFEPLSFKKPKIAPNVGKKNRRVVSSDDENGKNDSVDDSKRKQTASDLWVEVWCDVEEQWVCIDIFKGKIHCVDTIRASASSSLAYVFAFQNDLTVKDVTARYCPNWTTVVRKSRVDKTWLHTAIRKYLSQRTMRDIKEDQELRRIHEEKPMPTALSDYKNHPFYALERHLLKFEALYPPEAPALGYIRGEPVYSRDCVHTLHSRDIWLKQARTVKLGEKPYKVVKARPKWDRITQTVIKDQPLEIFGYWQTEDYDPPTAENGIVPRNAYGNVELFKPTMLPKKTKHIRLAGLHKICKKLGIDCANAVVGFDFHQGACHPTFDGYIVCEEFEDQVVAAWYQDQEEQGRRIQEKYEARVYGNWKKLIRGLLIRERLKLKYNF